MMEETGILFITTDCGHTVDLENKLQWMKQNITAKIFIIRYYFIPCISMWYHILYVSFIVHM